MINYNSQIVQDDLSVIYNQPIDWERLKNKTVLVTGATGMLASYFSLMLIYLNKIHQFNIQILLLVRNEEKAFKIFGKDSSVHYLIQDVCDEIKISQNVDFIIHAAGASSPYYILNNPVGIINANTIGTINVMELARKNKIEKVLFTSTREVYGNTGSTDIINEAEMGIIDPLDYRSCYPESKRMAETILKSYSLQYKIPFNSVRIAHSYGPGMEIENDGRVMSDFIRDAINKQNIILQSDGQAERAFCYVSDAVAAMFMVLLKGKQNEAYNIANETEPVKLVDLADLICKLSPVNLSFSFKQNENGNAGYCNYKRAVLDVTKLSELGWKPEISLKLGLLKTLESFQNK
jgi:nucleoside-diphosphate-sugar epimerase